MTHTRNIQEILKINKERNALLDELYNPIYGIGSMIPRSLLRYSDQGKVIEYQCPNHLLKMPVISKLAELGSVEKLVIDIFKEYSPSRHEQITEQLFQLRLDEDFEFYAFTCVTIPEKDGDRLVPFKLNRPQRKTIARYEKMRVADKPIRAIIVKARQWGGSTVTQIYMNWIQLRHKFRWNAAICTLVEAQAVHIRQMLNTTIENFPESVAKYSLSNYGGFNSKNKKINERDCVIGVGSTERPENLRTYNFRMLHLSEVASWKDTPGKSGRALMQSLRGTIRKLPYTMVVLESTAKGVGNLFHDEWLAAMEERSGYDPIFVAWFEIEMYREGITDFEAFVSNLTTYGWFLWDLGATLEGINWYMNHKKQENMSDLAMFQEFCSTAEESFTSTGRPAFNRIHIQRQYKNCREPIFVGDIRGKSIKGKEAFDDIEFIEQKNGNLIIYEYPDPSKITNRYVGWLDIGGRTLKADYSAMKIIDRYWMIDGGKPEVVALYYGHLDQDLLAWKASQIMYKYGKGLLAVEIQSLRNKGEESEGNHSMTILDEIANYYPNLYARSNPDDVRKGLPTKYGFSTNLLSKPMIIDTLNEALRDDLYIERHKSSLDEMVYYEIKNDGSYGSADGKHDDLVMSTAGTLWLALKQMPKPVELTVQERIIKRVINESTI
jgi:hypothetical protein